MHLELLKEKYPNKHISIEYKAVFHPPFVAGASNHFAFKYQAYIATPLGSNGILSEEFDTLEEAIEDMERLYDIKIKQNESHQ